MARSSLKTDPLVQWLSLTWQGTERSHNPDLKDFIVGLLDYPKAKVVMDDRGASGYPDLKLLNPSGLTWVVGELKPSDVLLVDPSARKALWEEKKKYIDGLTRFMIFVTAHFVWVVLPDGTPVTGFEEPLDLRGLSFTELKHKLAFLSFEEATHNRQWDEFVKGEFPFSYLELDDADVSSRLHGDLQSSFAELTSASTLAMTNFKNEFDDYTSRRAEIKRSLEGRPETQNRALVRLDLEHEFVRRLFSEALRQFEDQYGREVEQEARVREAFIADSVALLIARILFLRLVEDLKLMKKRRLSDGGPKNWAAFVEELTGDARALVRVASADVALRYPEPFAQTVFDWIQHANGQMDEALQRLILRLNAYNFAGLSEEILGDIYQQFLPRQKRKQLGEYYTPPSIVDWILNHTVNAHGVGRVLDPSCGSGSFLVRYTHARLEEARQRGLDAEEVRLEVQDEVWGFDLNPFAAFISLFQVTWALLRFAPRPSSPNVHVYNINSLLRDSDIVTYVGEENLPPGSTFRDNMKWKYIVGNPPYIRAERVKYSGEMQQLWQTVWGQNADTGLVFLQRALNEWLEADGFFGMVVSGGYANSETAAKVWRLLKPGAGCALRKIVWLEFVGKIWDANVIPMILIIEKTDAKPDDDIELFVPTQWPSDEAPSHIKYSDFFDVRVSPRVLNLNMSGDYGDYLLPLLQAGDIPILRKLYPNNEKFQRLGNVVDWTYGIQRGGVPVTDEPTGTRTIQVVGGRGLAVAWPGAPDGWVDLEAVDKRPYGKLSLWKQEPYPTKFLFVAKFGLSLIASVASPEQSLAGLDTTLVSRSTQNEPEAIAAFLNSKLAQFYWAVRLRAGVLEGSSRATFYPRTLDGFPWPKILAPEQEQQLLNGYIELARLAARAKDNPNEWLLAESERRNAHSHIKLSDPKLGLRFSGGVSEVKASELLLVENRLEVNLFVFAELGDGELAEYLFRLLTLTDSDSETIKPAALQKMVVPTEYSSLVKEYRARMQSFGEVEKDFLQALSVVDDVVYEIFEITPQERATIEARLSTPPLSRLQPRYPWQTVKPRPIKAYMEDRFI